MMKTILLYLKHFIVVTCLLLLTGFASLVAMQGSIAFGTDELAYKVGDEGPHIFHNQDSLDVMYIRGNRETGFSIEKTHFSSNETIDIEVYFPKDGSRFSLPFTAHYETPASHYNDAQPIFVMSDLEGNLATFRDFLLQHNVIDAGLTWQFGQGHLVLLGDMVDRGYATTQLLWFIYKLEQEAKLAGGSVHMIIGNHEIKNMQGNMKSAANKYIPIAGMLGKHHAELFGEDAAIGRWLASKNVVESINGYLFTHGGIHPEIAALGLSLDDINQTIRSAYRQYYYPREDYSHDQHLLISNKTGPAWYRGYFKDEVSEKQMDETLTAFNAKAIVVGHTLQFSVNSQFDGKLYAVDVKHPEDYTDNFPFKASEGLLLKDGQAYRLLDDGTRALLDD
ncbi:hypothetical protein DRW07_01940 [Alteromonas sediminis]|uniref:Calcineurin-like phosphoesterase domain-containing protein n=1 Tax=Alteromonas sediminis TaxID=2259342 RepID=A0A3N5ZAQ0_9ALTE|nr:metallophosphoesterase [Alteromonas sediminis]RPJ68194.1 hypothetical protein DRW07_01940 [Alteromonas sediminis]